MLGSKIIFILTYLFQAIFVIIFCFDLNKNCCIDLFHTVFLFTFFEGQVYQMQCNVVFPNYYIALHLMCLPFKIYKQKHCMRKASLG